MIIATTPKHEMRNPPKY